MSHRTADRRRLRRFNRLEEHGIRTTRVRPGHRADLVDVSAGGALIDTVCRLLPGTSVELHMETDARHAKVRGRVLRCAVVRICPTSVCYRGAIHFDRHLPWFVDEAGSAETAADVRPAHPRRADATREVI